MITTLCAWSGASEVDSEKRRKSNDSLCSLAAALSSSALCFGIMADSWSMVVVLLSNTKKRTVGSS